MTKVITRVNTVPFAISFVDENELPATVVSATLQLVYPGRDKLETEST